MIKIPERIKQLFLSDAAAQVEAIQAHVIGEKLTDFGLLEKRASLSGGPMEMTSFSSRRENGVHVFLNVTERLSGGTEQTGYPVGPRGIEQLRDILQKSPVELFPPVDPAKVPKTRMERFKKWIREGLAGEILHDFGCIDEIFIRGPAGAPHYYWRQTLRVLTTRKKGEDLLVLNIRYKAPGMSGDIHVPFGEEGRTSLLKILQGL